MKEIIESIEEADWGTGYDTFEGLVVKTNLQEIKIGIEGNQHCCESFGGMMSNDDSDDFIGAEILEIKLTDTALKTRDVSLLLEGGFDDGGIQFVDIETSKGTLQYAVYNAHNGYYGHEIQIVSNQLNHEDYL